MRYRVRKGYVFVTIEEKGKRVPQPNLTTVDDEDEKLRPFIHSQMHKLEPVEPKATREGKPEADRGGRRSEVSTRGGGKKGKKGKKGKGKK